MRIKMTKAQNKRVIIALGLVFYCSAFATETPLTNSGSIQSNKQALALTDVSKVSTEVKAVKNAAALGVLLGGRYVNYESNYFYVGGNAYTGQLNGSGSGAFTYGGILMGIDGRLGLSTHLEFTLLFGGGGGFVGQISGGSLLLEPCFSLSIFLGNNVQSAITVGYIWMPAVTAFSGVTSGLRFDFLDRPKQN